MNERQKISQTSFKNYIYIHHPITYYICNIFRALQSANACRLIGKRLLKVCVSMKQFWQPQSQRVIRGSDETGDQTHNDRSTKERRFQYHHGLRVYVFYH